MLADYWKALRSHLPATLTGVVATVIAATFAILGAVQAWVPFAVIAVVALALAQFLAWRGAWNERNALAGKLAPLLTIECGDAPEFAAVQLRATDAADPAADLPDAAPCYLKTVAITNQSGAIARNVRARVVAVELAPSSGRGLHWLDLINPSAPKDVCDLPPGECRHAIVWQRWVWTDPNNKVQSFGGLPLFDVVGRQDALVVEITAWADEGPTARCRMRITGAETAGPPGCQRLGSDE